MGKRDKWKRELEKEMEAAGLKKKVRGKDKTLHLKASDFPCIIDGISFQTIGEYFEFVHDGGNSFLEMPGTDQQTYDEVLTNWDKFAANPKTKRNQPVLPFRGNHNNWSDYKYEPPKPKPEYTLQKNYFAVVEHIEHMRYIIFRDEAHGDYYAIWLATLDDYKTAMSEVSSLELWKYVDKVTKLTVVKGQFHCKGPHSSYNRAEDWFHKGGETLWRVKERLKKAKDPNWIPPNLRQLAIMAFVHSEVWKRIPQDEHQRLLKWLDAGCPGWYKSTPKHLRKGCISIRENPYEPLPEQLPKKEQPKEQKALPAPKPEAAKSEPSPQHKTIRSMMGQIWDSTTKTWIHFKPGMPN